MLLVCYFISFLSLFLIKYLIFFSIIFHSSKKFIDNIYWDYLRWFHSSKVIFEKYSYIQKLFYWYINKKFCWINLCAYERILFESIVEKFSMRNYDIWSLIDWLIWSLIDWLHLPIIEEKKINLWNLLKFLVFFFAKFVIVINVVEKFEKISTKKKLQQYFRKLFLRISNPSINLISNR